MPRRAANQGFTLIELSVVLVIIGLVVGGILVGKDLIKAAEVRAQISQIEKYNSAVNTFYNKYAALPGDISAANANQFGFATRGQYAGEGDGNGVIEGVSADAAASNSGAYESAGETVMFWADLATAGMIPGSYPSASATAANSNGWGASVHDFSFRFPSGVIPNSYVYAFSVSGKNFFASSAFQGIVPASTNGLPALPVVESYAIDSKIDDGLPQTGNVLAGFLGQFGFGWDIDPTRGNGLINNGLTPYTNGSWPPSGSTCADDRNISSGPQYYSISSLSNYGVGANCGLSFKMQGAGR